MGTKMKRFLSMLLAVLMVISTPVTVFAENGIATSSTSAEDMVSIDAVAKNTATDKTYEDLLTALAEAADGESIVLSKDVETTIVTVPENVTLDLNGHTLTASYVASFGDVVDGSADNAGLLKAAPSRIIIQEDNEQISVRTAEGYKFFEVIKYNTRYVEEESKYAFQPFIEAGAHEILKQGAENAGATVNVRISWVSADGKRSQDFVYNDEMTFDFFESYDAEKDQYGRMFTLVLNGAELYKNLTFCAVVVSDTGVSNYSKSVVLNEDVTTEGNGELSENVTLNNEQASAFVAEGTKVDGEALTLTTEEMSETTADIQLADGEEMLSLNVHVNGVAKDNTVPVLVTIDEIAPEYLNQGNITLYHVENGETVEMTRVYSLEEVDAHNEFYYDILTGTITMALASFSEIAIVNDAGNAWNGEYDYSWYTNAVAPVDGEGATEHTIANADQLAAFGAIVGGMNGQTRDSFAGKTVKLLADVNLGDSEEENDSKKIFYPIGYYNNIGSYEKVSGKVDDKAVTSSVDSFEGTFDGNGHTISNFYQNTWEMFGDYNDGYSGTPNHYKDAMGLFGYVVNGTVKNLTVDNFSSDGEFTPTGVIAAYAVNSTFENIAITNCNPRVYNTGNGGIVGIGGNSTDTSEEKMTFTNITVDNSNKISALWGSWDVACGGLMGMFRGYSTVKFTNCHVAAQIDVFNDVCGNYQYYWYRYAGMMIGSLRGRNTTDGNGYTIPNMQDITADGCTVHFGDWNDYYYCELVANSLASYTHDHQFSRLDQIKSLDEIKSGDAWLKTGNFLLITKEEVNGEEKVNETCYHIVKDTDGTLKQHLHTDAGEETVDVNGDGVKETVLKENNQIVYLPFNQLFQGDGWGVKHVPIYDDGTPNPFGGVTILDREVADSVVKFRKIENANNSYETEKMITIGLLFEATEYGLSEKTLIDNKNVQVSVSPANTNSTAGGTYVANEEDWTQGTLVFSGEGDAIITITDYYFCIPTTINVTITEKKAAEKFETKFTGDFLYRVGNAKDSAVALGSLFKAKDGAEIGNVSVNVETITGASGDYISNATWTNGTIQFSGTGIVKVIIKDDDTYCAPTELLLEVVDAVNATEATSATKNNVVLLSDIGSGFTVSGRYTVYGNGFTLKYTGNGQYLNNGLKQGIVTVSENGTLDNLRIKASIYPNAYLYYGPTLLGDYVQGGPSTVEGDRTRYHYQLSAVAMSGNATVSNCYIYGGRNNIFVNTGDVTITDSVLECGVVANVQIQSNSSHTVTFNNVTTIQQQVNPTLGDTSKVMLGAGVLVGPETTENPKIVLKGEFKQYNWVYDGDTVSDEATQKIIDGALDATAFNHTINGKKASNLGIIYMNDFDGAKPNVTNETKLPYQGNVIEMNALGNKKSGTAYSLQGAEPNQIYYDTINAPRNTINGYYEPQFKYSADLGGQYIEKTDNGDEHCYHEGDTVYVMFPSGDTKELNLESLVNITKYTGQELNLVVTCKDDDGNDIEVTSGKVTLSEQKNYKVTYTVTDTLFYDKVGKIVTGNKKYSWDITLDVSLKDTAVPDARFEFDATKQKMGYYKPTIGDVKQYIPFLAGLKIYDYNGKTEYLRFDGSNDFNKVVSITITGYESNKALVEIKLTDGGVINTRFLSRANSGGGSTYTGKIKTSKNTIYFVTDSGTSNKDTTTTAAYWYVDYYKFTGNNGVAIQSAQQTFNSNGSSASTPSGDFSTTIKYTVTFDANGGNCSQTTAYATSASAAVTLPTPIRSGYMFAGWYTAASEGTRVGGAGDSYTPSANITLYAQWGKPCTVTYNANGGICGTPSEKYTGTALTLPTPTRDGYWFMGWYDAAEGGNKVGNAGVTYNPAGDKTLYAQWSPVYTVIYNANGGSVNPASVEYKGVAFYLPLPTRNAFAFDGWYTAASGGTKIGDAGASYTPTANITLYAQWKDPVKVTYNANGGSCDPESQTYLGTPLSLATPTRIGYTFNGWYTAASGGTKIGDAGASYTPSANITLYARWSINSYTIKVTTNNATVKVNGTQVNNNKSVSIQYGAQVTVEVTYNETKEQNTTITGTDGTKYDSSFTMPAQDVKIVASSEKEEECIVEGTLITMADGTQKAVEDLQIGDMLMVFNHINGKYEASPLIFNTHSDDNEAKEFDVLKLYFSDGEKVEVVQSHGFFDTTLLKYVYINYDNYSDFIGHEFYKMSEDGFGIKVKLESAVVEKEITRIFCPVTYFHMNSFANGFLNTPNIPGDITGLVNYFEYDMDLKYNEEAMQRDIETYGLYTYDDFKDYISEAAYNSSPAVHLKVAVGKGMITFEQILDVIEYLLARSLID